MSSVGLKLMNLNKLIRLDKQYVKVLGGDGELKTKYYEGILTFNCDNLDDMEKDIIINVGSNVISLEYIISVDVPSKEIYVFVSGEYQESEDIK